MDKYLVPTAPSSEYPKPILRRRWKRSLVELNGKFESKYRHDFYGLLMESYFEVGAFPHFYHIDGVPCQTHVNSIVDSGFNNPNSCRKQGVSALEFDNKGIYLATVTKSGCLTVHDFESLYSQVILNPSVGLKEDETKQLLHIFTCQQLDVVRWNLANQDEIACTSVKSSEVHIFDIGYISSKPVEVLRKKPTVTVHGCHVQKGLSDIAFSSNDDSRLLASDMFGIINVWDRRVSDLPCLELTTNSSGALNSIIINAENQIIFGASKHGMIYMWDLRGGRTSTAFQSHKEVLYAPFISMKLASKLAKIGSLKAQSNIVSKEIHSIAINPSCPYQLAFHLDDGWSGVLDINNLQVTHIHCPPPPWLDDSIDWANLSQLGKPSWLPTHSIYAVGSLSSNGIHLLDFYPDTSSPCHVDYNEDIQNIAGVHCKWKQNRFIPLSEGVTACAAHPLNGTIIAGTKQSSLLVISEMHKSCRSGDNCPN